MNDKLQEKLNYFYGPYTRKEPAGQPLSMCFNEDNEIKAENPHQLHTERAKKRWGSLSRNLFSKNTNSFRKFIQSVNPQMYTKLKEVGIQYYLDEFENPRSKYSFPDIQKHGKTQDEKMIENEQFESIHLNQGLKMLKKAVKNRMAKNTEEGHKTAEEDFIQPLVYLLRGNRDIKLKKKQLLKSIEKESKVSKPKEKAADSSKFLKKWESKNTSDCSISK